MLDFGGQPVPRPRVFASSVINGRNASIWDDNQPQALSRLCASYIVRHPSLYRGKSDAAMDEDGANSFGSVVKVELPPQLWDLLLKTLHEDGFDVDNTTANVFRPGLTALTRVCVSDSSIDDLGLNTLLGHEPCELDVHNCEQLSRECLEDISAHSSRLRRLNIGNSVQILPDYLYPPSSEDDDLDEEDRDSLELDPLISECSDRFHHRGYMLRADRLKELSIKNLYVKRGNNAYLNLLLRPLTTLTHLDLSGMVISEGLDEGNFLRTLNNLVSIVLHNVNNALECVDAICTLQNLRHVDLSTSDERSGMSSSGNQEILYKLTKSLPELQSLDISGTDLAGTGVFEAGRFDINPDCDIPGLECRVDKPLNFLGLYKTQYEACRRSKIPAIHVSGDSNESQILTAGRHYIDRALVIENVLNDLYHLISHDSCTNLKEALNVILTGMDAHPTDKLIQISGAAGLYYVVKSSLRSMINANFRVKRKLVSTLLNGMLTHKCHAIMIRNGCLTLSQLSIPKDLSFDFERIVRMILFIISADYSNDEHMFIQQAGIFILNSFAIEVDGEQKLLLGDYGAIERLLALVRHRLQIGLCDDVLETSWSCLWNVTDETALNCKRFLDNGGMDLFLKCKRLFPGKHNLLRNMMGLLGNVAEVSGLRHCLMTTQFVDEFYHLLDSKMDNIEVSYNAAGVLAHMASDGAQAWTIDYPRRRDVLTRMEQTINKWSIETQRNINYRSFEPILRLVACHHTPHCQLWATWALANLTCVDQEKYCVLLEQEKGVELLQELVQRQDSHKAPKSTAVTQVVKLASMVLRNVADFKSRPQHVDD